MIEITDHNLYEIDIDLDRNSDWFYHCSLNIDGFITSTLIPKANAETNGVWDSAKALLFLAPLETYFLTNAKIANVAMFAKPLLAPDYYTETPEVSNEFSIARQQLKDELKKTIKSVGLMAIAPAKLIEQLISMFEALTSRVEALEAKK